MGKPGGFVEFRRQECGHRPVEERVGDHREIDVPLPGPGLRDQAARCMECGIPFCHSEYGCPVKNRIPDFNDLVWQGRWRDACEVLHATNNFPEITGRVCPAPCEAACTLNIAGEPVTIKHIEFQIAERGFSEGWIQPLPPRKKTGRRVAVVGSGPAGLAAAQQLARAGHEVTVFEKDDRVGGLLRYGIPDFKLEKRILDRRLAQMAAEGITFQTGVEAGADVSAKYLRRMFDAICLTMGAGVPRDLSVPGRGYENVVPALDFLTQQNRINAGDALDPESRISARDRVVIVVGGGDTGSDCVGTARRQGAREIHQLEILPRPPGARPADTPWPLWPRVLRTSSSHEEGCQRRWSVLTQRLSGTEVTVGALHGIEVEWTRGEKGPRMKELPGTEFTLKADLVLLAMGFLHVRREGLVEQLGVELDGRGNLKVSGGGATSVPGVFAAGDAAQGASLVVRAIAGGREAARAIDRALS
jgi:NAD(P)H-dependent glutamate synthase small subunit